MVALRTNQPQQGCRFPKCPATHLSSCSSLDKAVGESDLTIMRVDHLIGFFTRVLSLALMGFVVASGAAFAHEAYGPSGVDVQRTVAHAHHKAGPVVDRSSDVATADQPAISVATRHAVHGTSSEAPCSEDRAGGHGKGTCCTMACHAALPTPLIDPVGSHGLHGLRVPGLTNMLVGRSSDRTERPPRIG